MLQNLNSAMLGSCLGEELPSLSCAVCCNYSSQSYETYGKFLVLLTNIRPVINVREFFMAIIYEWAKISKSVFPGSTFQPNQCLWIRPGA
jgi:hypothetical protein